jgi:APA family basic amino acid/polyamine antiporter
MADQLKRSLNLPGLTAYGIATIVGAGIFVLVGEVAGKAGLLAPLSFLLASIIAAFSGISFAELCSRFPRAGGEAIYVHQASGSSKLALTVGLLVALAGAVSCGALANGFAGYFKEFADWPRWLVICGVMAALAGVAAWGIGQSAALIIATASVSVIGILMVIWGGRASLATLPERWSELPAASDPGTWLIVATGMALAFYAFIGFEDIVNVAEETKNPSVVAPRAIFIALGASTALYVALSLVAVLSVPLEKLSESDAPLALVYRETTNSPSWVISLIGLITVIDGVLAQIIMVSRVLYGMASQGWLPKAFAHVAPNSKTPLLGIAAASGTALALALWFPLGTLAVTTSFLLLVVFAAINASLIAVKRRDPQPEGATVFPIVFPIIGMILSGGLALFQGARFLGLVD